MVALRPLRPGHSGHVGTPMVDKYLRCEKNVDLKNCLMGLDKFPQNNSNTGRVFPFRDNSLQIPSVHLGMIPFSEVVFIHVGKGNKHDP